MREDSHPGISLAFRIALITKNEESSEAKSEHATLTPLYFPFWVLPHARLCFEHTYTRSHWWFGVHVFAWRSFNYGLHMNWPLPYMLCASALCLCCCSIIIISTVVCSVNVVLWWQPGALLSALHMLHMILFIFFILEESALETGGCGRAVWLAIHPTWAQGCWRSF